MIILRQKNYTKPADEDNSEPKKKKSKSGLKKAAVVGGSLIGAAGLYQGSKHLQREVASRLKQKTTQNLFDTLQKATPKKEDKTKIAVVLDRMASSNVKNAHKMSRVEKLGHTLENTLKPKKK